MPINIENIKLDSFIKSYLNPKYIFIPINEGDKLRVKDNSYVYKNDIVLLTKDNMCVYSSISGKVLGVKDSLYVSGVKPSLVIENDFKENMRMKRSAVKFIESYDKSKFMNLILDTSLSYNGKYLYNKLNEKHKILIVNGVENEPLFGNKYFFLRDDFESILEVVDKISELFKYERVIVAIKNTDSDIINNFMSVIGTYPNIELRLLPDEHTYGIEKYLCKQLNVDDALVLNTDEVMYIYEVLKKEIPCSFKIITITGDSVNPRQVIKVKKGCLLSEIFVNNFDFTDKTVDVYINGLMKGHLTNTLKYVVDDDLDGIVIMKHEDKVVGDCINCGLCNKSCPIGLNPKYVCDHKGIVKAIYKEGCIECGICNRVCPANRDLMRYMKGNYHE